MTLDEIRTELEMARGIPRAALAAAVEQAEAFSPAVIELIDLACKGVVLTRPQENLLFYGAHAMAAACRTELYEPLLDLIACRSDDLDLPLADADTQALLISTCGPDGEAPFDLLESPDIDGSAKSSLFLMVARLVWEGRASREQFVALLDRFDREATEEPADSAWFGWQSAIALLGLTEFEERVRAGWQAGRLPYDRDVDHDAWLEELHQAARDPRDESLFALHHARPIDDVFASLSWMEVLGPDEPLEEDSAQPDDPARDIRLIEQELDWLAYFLASDAVPGGRMTLEYLDGFLAALAVGPDKVAREEWRSRLWSDSEGETSDFQTEPQERYVHELLDRRLGTIQRRLAAGYPHEPLVGEASLDDAVEEWAVGFAVGMDLVPPSTWDAVAKHKQAGLALASIILLLPPDQLAEKGEDDLEPLDRKTRAGVVRRLPDILQMIHSFWHDQSALPLFEPRRSQKIGRNEPCPCGSGRKYKKCCGANASA
ncbi:MAG TPA: UPF0149 family protein [Dongiaceae bacterium]|jgi:uncharacterized protein|nr:UPF0149 family protein [Dongiaceae bacterium]